MIDDPVVQTLIVGIVVNVAGAASALYLYLQERRERYLLFWGLAWTIGAARFAIHFPAESIPALRMTESLVLFPLLFFFHALGAYDLLPDKPWQRRHVVATTAGALLAYGIVGQTLGQPVGMAYGLASVTFFLSGLCLWRAYRAIGMSGHAFGAVTLMAWSLWFGLGLFALGSNVANSIIGPLFGIPLAFSLVIIAFQRRDRELVESERTLQTIFDTAPTPIVITRAPGGQIDSANALAWEMLNLSRDAVVGGTTFDDDIGADAGMRARLYADLESGRRVTGREYVIHRDGATRRLIVNADRLEVSAGARYIFTFSDITEQRRAENELRESEQRFRQLFEGVRDVVFSLMPDGTITLLNPAFDRITGLRAADWIGRSFLDLIHPDDQARAVEELQQSLDGHPQDTTPLRVRTSAGYLLGEINTAPRIEDGRAVNVLGIGRDVSERVGLEEQLRQSQKMEAIGRLAGGIAHDFNNLLTVIIGLGELTLAEVEGQPALAADVREMVSAGKRAAELTHQLLAFSRRQVLAPRELDLSSVLAGMDKMLRRLIGEDVTFSTVSAPDLWVIRADPGQLEQVIANLAVNARDAMPGGGFLRVSTANVELDEAFVAARPGARCGPHVRLTVTDTGTGMAPEVQSRIFEPFFTTKEVGRGTGLGLATVLGIVQQSGGYVAVSTEIDRGTTFDLYFPRVNGPSSGGGDTPLPAVASGTETILVVEDSPVLRDLAARALRDAGYTVVHAAGGDEALEKVSRYGGTIDLLVSDVVMPGMSGRALADQLIRLCPALKVLFVSGYPDEVLGGHGILATGLNLLPKPFTPLALTTKVREVIDGI